MALGKRRREEDENEIDMTPMLDVVFIMLIFFIVTNFSVWLGDNLYPLNLNGLIQCYVMAIPFFHNTLISTFIFLAILFTSYSFAEKKYPFLKKI